MNSNSDSFWYPSPPQLSTTKNHCRSNRRRRPRSRTSKPWRTRARQRRVLLLFTQPKLVRFSMTFSHSNLFNFLINGHKLRSLVYWFCQHVCDGLKLMRPRWMKGGCFVRGIVATKLQILAYCLSWNECFVNIGAICFVIAFRGCRHDKQIMFVEHIHVKNIFSTLLNLSPNCVSNICSNPIKVFVLLHKIFRSSTPFYKNYPQQCLFTALSLLHRQFRAPIKSPASILTSIRMTPKDPVYTYLKKYLYTLYLRFV